jgi:hypothetical protein
MKRWTLLRLGLRSEYSVRASRFGVSFLSKISGAKGILLLRDCNSGRKSQFSSDKGLFMAYDFAI